MKIKHVTCATEEWGHDECKTLKDVADGLAGHIARCLKHNHIAEVYFKDTKGGCYSAEIELSVKVTKGQFIVGDVDKETVLDLGFTEDDYEDDETDWSWPEGKPFTTSCGERGSMLVDDCCWEADDSQPQRFPYNL
jgi:hypothetical protein